MNVKTLREMLAQFDDAAEVKFAYDFGDYWRTTVARTINCVDERAVEYSDYHRMHKVLNDDEDWDDKKIVVVLS